MKEYFWLEHGFINTLKNCTQSYMTKRTKKDQIQPSFVPFIITLHRHGSCTQTELTKQIACDKGYTARMVKVLLSKKIAKREILSLKTIIISLTKKGERIANALHEYMNEWHGLLFSGLSEEEIEEMKHLTNKLAANAIKYSTYKEET